MQIKVDNLKADKDRLQTAKSDLSNERDSLKKQLQAEHNEMSKLKVLISGDVHHIAMFPTASVVNITKFL